MHKTSNILRFIQFTLLVSIIATANASQPQPGELDNFVLWSIGAKLDTLSPKQLEESLKRFKVSAEETYGDKRYRFFRGYPHFIDGVFKFRYERSGEDKPKIPWNLLDASFYFPGLSQADVQQLINKLENKLGKPAGSKQNDIILAKRWMLGEFIELSLRVDKEVGDVGLTYSVLQGDMPF